MTTAGPMLQSAVHDEHIPSWPKGSRVQIVPACGDMDPEECARQGGHCFRRTGVSRASSPPQYEEVCKHCRKSRWAIPREPFEYRDA